MHMDFKTEYITRLFQNISKKKFELYCITRLWHNLDNDAIKFVPQQYVNMHDNNYALTDIYLPQFNLHIEVNESAHYSSKEKIESDNLRKNEIKRNTGHEIIEVDCSKSIDEINQQIESIVKKIKDKLIEQQKNNSFKPWDPHNERNPNYWKQKGVIKSTEEVALGSIEDICVLFEIDLNAVKRGYLRKPAVIFPKDQNYLIWWPSNQTRSGWLNDLIDDGRSIVESHIQNQKLAKHFHENIDSTLKRIVFFHNKDVLGLTSYKFIGIFAVDKGLSSPEKGIVYTKLADEFFL